MKKCFFALVLPLALLLTACGKEPRPAALLLGQAADLNESEPLLVIDGQNIPAWEYLYWLALDCRQMEERCEAAGEPVDWTAPLSEGGTPEDLVKADALVDTALYAAVGTWAAAYGCTLTDAERNALPERHYAYLTLEQGRHLTETGVQYAKLYALYETPGSALAPAENELALFEQQTAPLTAERLLIPFESDREAARQKAAELFAHLNTAADPSAAFDALLADNAAYLTIMPDNFKRVTTITKDAEIMYQINRSNVRPGELTKEQVKMFEDFVKEYSNKDRATLGNVYAKGYASPDGPVKFNDELSKKRSESGQEAIAKKLSSVNPKYDIAAYGEDWEGFKELVSASDIEDKDLILQVLAMQDNPVKRDEEIKSMTAVFEVLAKEILPQLRRTKLIADVDIEGRTDAEIKEAAAKNIDVLSEEEMLYAATLTDDNAAKLKAYEAAASKYNSVRGYNNAGVILAKEGKLAQAKAQLDKAAAMSKDAAITNNLGVVALMNGDLATAQKYLSALNTADSKANMGLVNLAEGNYAEAAKTLSGYDLAVAEVPVSYTHLTLPTNSRV